MIVIVDGEEYQAVQQHAAPVAHQIEFKRQAKRKWPDGRWDVHGLDKMIKAQNAFVRAHNEWEASDKQGDEPEPPETTEEFLLMLTFFSVRKVKKIRLDDLDDAEIDIRKEPEDEDGAEESQGEPDPTKPGQDSPATPGDAQPENDAETQPPHLPSMTSNSPSASGWPSSLTDGNSSPQ